MSADKTEYTAKFEETDEFIEKNVTITITVSKRKPDVTLPTEIEATYGDTLADVKLPDGWSFKAELTTTVGDAGNNEFDVIFTPEDTEIYETVDGKITIAVAQATPNYTLPTGLKAIYGQTLSEIALVDETADGTWRYRDDAETTTVGDAGANEFEVMFIPRDTKNYKTIRGQKVIIEVAQATPNYTLPTGLKTTYGKTLADVTLPAVSAEEIEQGATAGQWSYVDADETSVGNVGNNEFEVMFIPADQDNYKVVTGLKVTITVAKARPSFTLPTGLTATYGNTLANVELPIVTAEEIAQGATPGTWSYQDETTTSVGNVGNNQFAVIFTPEDTDNYEIINTEKVTISVGKATPDYELPTGLTATYKQTLADVAPQLPVITAENANGKTLGRWEFEDDLATPVGTVGANLFKVKFIPADGDNYNDVRNQEVTITVGKATPVYTKPENLTATYGDKLANVPLPTVTEEAIAQGATPGTWSYVYDDSTPVGNAGDREFEVRFEPTGPDKDNYKVVVIKVIIKVAKANPTYTAPTGLTATYGDKLSTVTTQLPEGFEFENMTAETTVGNANAEGNDFTVKYIPEDTANYNIVENIPVKVVVEKANPEYTTPTGLTATYGDKLSTVATQLPEGFAFENMTDKTTVGNANKEGNDFTVKYTPGDTANYNVVEHIAVKVIVAKARPNVTAPTGLTATYGQTLANVKSQLPERWSFIDEDTSVGNAGTNSFPVVYVPADRDNYEVVADLTVEIEVAKANPTYTVPTGLKATYGDKLSTVATQLPEGFEFENMTDETTVGNANAEGNDFTVKYTPGDTDNYNVVEHIAVKVVVEKAIQITTSHLKVK